MIANWSDKLVVQSQWWIKLIECPAFVNSCPHIIDRYSLTNILPNWHLSIDFFRVQPTLCYIRIAWHALPVELYPSCGPFYLHGLTLIPAWISNYILYKVWNEITLNWACDYVSMLGLKLNHVIKRIYWILLTIGHKSVISVCLMHVLGPLFKETMTHALTVWIPCNWNFDSW